MTGTPHRQGSQYPDPCPGTGQPATADGRCPVCRCMIRFQNNNEGSYRLVQKHGKPPWMREREATE